MNDTLACILDWANINDISLDNAEIYPSYRKYDYDLHKTINIPKVVFNHAHETRRNMVQVKRAVNFAPEGPPPVESLYGMTTIACGSLRVEYRGAYECKSLGYDCKPAGWSDEQID